VGVGVEIRKRRVSVSMIFDASASPVKWQKDLADAGPDEHPLTESHSIAKAKRKNLEAALP